MVYRAHIWCTSSLVHARSSYVFTFYPARHLARVLSGNVMYPMRARSHKPKNSDIRFFRALLGGVSRSYLVCGFSCACSFFLRFYFFSHTSSCTCFVRLCHVPYASALTHTQKLRHPFLLSPSRWCNALVFGVRLLWCMLVLSAHLLFSHT